MIKPQAFYLGLVLSKLKVVENVVSKYAFVCFIIGVAVWVAGRFLHPFFMKTGGIMFSFALSVIADRYLRRLFFSFRNYTYQIFLMGIFAQFAVKILYRHFSIPYIPAFILCILFGLYVPVLISKIVQAINWKPLSLCMGLKHISK